MLCLLAPLPPTWVRALLSFLLQAEIPSGAHRSEFSFGGAPLCFAILGLTLGPLEVVALEHAGIEAVDHDDTRAGRFLIMKSDHRPESYLGFILSFSAADKLDSFIWLNGRNFQIFAMRSHPLLLGHVRLSDSVFVKSTDQSHLLNRPHSCF